MVELVANFLIIIVLDDVNKRLVCQKEGSNGTKIVRDMVKNIFDLVESKIGSIVVENIGFQNHIVEDGFKGFIVIAFDRVSIIFEKISIKEEKSMYIL